MHNYFNKLVVKPQLARKQQQVLIPPSARPSKLAKQVAGSKAKNSIIGPVNTKDIIERAKQAISKPEKIDEPKGIAKLADKPLETKIKNTVSQVVNKRNVGLNKKKPSPNKGVKYVTGDVSANDIELLRNIRGYGAGKILVIVGNGPSVLEAPLDKLKGNPYIETMSINKPDSRIWPTTYWSFFDQSQLRRHRNLWDGYNGTLFNSTSIKEKQRNTIRIKNIQDFGFSHDLTSGFHIGRSSVYGSMQIALWLNFTHIYIFGCDMTEVNGMMHFYGVNPDVPENTRKDRFEREAAYYDDGASRLDPIDRNRFTFCSSFNPWPFVNKFNKMDHVIAVDHILNHARSLYNV